ncbi:SH3 domain-containing protein [Brevibacillus sp. SYSU BS000544]|uniref:SH3 domain-containing protein n=1 Tax=Brevibacillus sp. SYSU BS000544 TaxID=3416443 RepID=UPI003CE4AA8D
MKKNTVPFALMAIILCGTSLFPSTQAWGTTKNTINHDEQTESEKWDFEDDTPVEITGDEWLDHLKWSKDDNQYTLKLTSNVGDDSENTLTVPAPLFFEPQSYTVEDVTGDAQPDLVVTLRDQAAGSDLVYWVIEGGNTPEVLYQSDAYPQGRATVSSEGVAITYSVYEEGDSNAFPSKRVTEQWSGKRWKLQDTSTQRMVKSRTNIEIMAAQNPPYHEIEKMIEDVAKEYDIPAAIFKAVAWQESSWRQFDSNGNPLISYDGGIGIMQLTNQTKYDQQKLKTDIKYNLKAGAEVLLEKRSYTKKGLLPEIGSMDEDEMESWYFALWAYNGWSVYNNPHNIPNKFRKTAAYQDSVLAIARDYYAQPITRISKSLIPKEGVPNGTLSYDTPLPIHESGEDLKRRQIKVGDTVEVATYITSLNVRQSAGLAGKVVDTLKPAERAEVTKNSIEKDGFLWYQVKSVDGSGWVAGHYLNAVRDTTVSLAELLNNNFTAITPDSMAKDGRSVYLEAKDATVNLQSRENGNIAKVLMAHTTLDSWVKWTESKPKEKLPKSTKGGFLKSVSIKWGATNIPLTRSVQVSIQTDGLEKVTNAAWTVKDKSGKTTKATIKESPKNSGTYSIAPAQKWDKNQTYTVYYHDLPITRFTTIKK